MTREVSSLPFLPSPTHPPFPIPPPNPVIDSKVSFFSPRRESVARRGENGPGKKKEKGEASDDASNFSPYPSFRERRRRRRSLHNFHPRFFLHFFTLFSYQDGAISESHQRGGLPLALFCIALPPSLPLAHFLGPPRLRHRAREPLSFSPLHQPSPFLPLLPSSSSIPTREAPAYTDSGEVEKMSQKKNTTNYIWFGSY